VLTLEAAGALLLVCLGVAILLFFGCAAMIFARTKIAPHADCKLFMDKQATQIDELYEKFKHRGKVAGGRARMSKLEDEPAAEPAPGPVASNQTADFQRIVREHAMKKRLG